MSDPGDVSSATAKSAAPPPEAAASVADGRPRQLDPRTIQQGRIEGLLTTAVLSFGSLVGTLIFLVAASPSRTRAALVLAGWFVATLGAVALALSWPPVRYRHTTYRLDERGLQIRSGVFFRSIVDVTHSRVQHTDVQQGPLERAFDLATLLVHTAGTQHAVIPLSGLEHGVALRIRDYLLTDDDG